MIDRTAPLKVPVHMMTCEEEGIGTITFSYRLASFISDHLISPTIIGYGDLVIIYVSLYRLFIVHNWLRISDRTYPNSSSASPSRKRSRSPAASVPLSSPTLGALSYARADLLPSPKRINGSNGINACFAYADALRDIGVDARVVVEAIDREEIETGGSLVGDEDMERPKLLGILCTCHKHDVHWITSMTSMDDELLGWTGEWDGSYCVLEFVAYFGINDFDLGDGSKGKTDVSIISIIVVAATIPTTFGCKGMVFKEARKLSRLGCCYYLDLDAPIGVLCRRRPKYGLKRIVMNAKGFFFFKFDSWTGLDAVLEGGPWMIHNSSIILKKWSMNTSLQKKRLTRIPDLDGPGYTKVTIRVEYEWKPPRCLTCNIFGLRSVITKESSAGNKLPHTHTVDDDEEEDVENIWDESENFNLLKKTGAQHILAHKRLQMFSVSFLEKNNDVWEPTPKQKECFTGDHLYKKDDLVDVMIMAQTNQVMHVQVNTRADHKTLFCSFVYADNYYIDRRVLWSNLVGHVGLMKNRPWILLGDFNAALNLEDHSTGAYEPNAAMREFKECVQAMEVADVISTGLHLTWNKKPKGSHGILKKIDRIMETGWNVNLEGCAMFRVVKRLKGLKSPFRKLLHNHGNLHKQVNKIRIELDEAQKAIDRDPFSSLLPKEHAHYLLAFKEAQLDEERFLKQKAKIKWLKAGDSNTAYFHKIVKSKCDRIRIEMVSDASNNLYEGNQVPGAFVNHYNQFLGAKGVTIPLDNHDLFTRVLDDAKADFMVRDVSNDEDVVSGDITCAVRDFFSNGKLLKELNHTIISLIPKIIANMVKEGLGDIVSINQSAFVPGRRISDNILLMQELMRNYHRRHGPPRCAFKVDIQKAYDTVDWSFLETIVVVMETLTLILQRRVRDSDVFHSVAVILDALEEFKQVSGLVPSISKSTTFFCNVPNAIKASILNTMPFAEGVLLVRYLGVPLISSRLLYRDCKILVEKLESRFNDWRNKFLSLAGRFQLIRSVLSSMHIYWASVFILPNRIVHVLEQLMRSFLWCQGEMKKGKAKVA
ncbi:sodium/hydrogen exchanger 6 [Tanacetum coccineum]